MESNTSSSEFLTLATSLWAHTHSHTHTQRKSRIISGEVLGFRAQTRITQRSWYPLKNKCSAQTRLIHTNMYTHAVVLSTMVQCINNTVSLSEVFVTTTTTSLNTTLRCYRLLTNQRGPGSRHRGKPSELVSLESYTTLRMWCIKTDFKQ